MKSYLWLKITALGIFACASTLAVQLATTERISESSTGEQGNEHSSEPSVSADGRYIAFKSYATNFDENDTNGSCDVFVRDRLTGETKRVSITSSGEQGNNNSAFPSINADGRYVAFQSFATNLVSLDTNNALDVFVHDRQIGETTRVSVSSAGVEGNGNSGDPYISGDGRYVVFESVAKNLVAGDTNNATDVFVHDRLTGETFRASVSSTGTEGNGGSTDPCISADGRYVAFESTAKNLVSGDTNNAADVFVHDILTGETKRVSVSSLGTQGNFDSNDPFISADGKFIAFISRSSTLVAGDTNSKIDVFVHEIDTGRTTRVSVSSSGAEGNGDCANPSLNEDGRFVGFDSLANNFVSNDTNGFSDVFVHDRQTGKTIRISISSSGMQGNFNSFFPFFNADGKLVAFYSYASNLVSEDTNGYYDVFLHRPAYAVSPIVKPPRE
ncbi:MAG TPA: hypothetical protein VNK96_04215 [Fimbriimonadales bacterium]|nr:hypothetical protein [Fimbriimonadales bacterium]